MNHRHSDSLEKMTKYTILDETTEPSHKSLRRSSISSETVSKPKKFTNKIFTGKFGENA